MSSPLVFTYLCILSFMFVSVSANFYYHRGPSFGRNGMRGKKSYRPPFGVHPGFNYIGSSGFRGKQAIPAAGHKPIPAAGRKPIPAAGRKPIPAAGRKPIPAAGRKPIPAAGRIPIVRPGVAPVKPGPVAETDDKGQFHVVNPNSGVSAMHLQLLPNNKLIMFDATSLGRSEIQLAPGNCRRVVKTGVMDCFAHSVEYDLKDDKVRVLKVLTDPWCSSGGLAPDGTLVSTGGWIDGEKSIRYMAACDNCDWRESNIKLAEVRWYGTQVLLADGRFVVIGGRRAFSYEFLAPEGRPGTGKIDLPFLRATTDIYENNLYPFIHMAPDGNLFILANFKSILLDVRTNRIVKNYPDLPGGARNYPGSASSAMLTIDLNNPVFDIDVMVCGGGQPLAFGKAEKEGIYLPALDTCGRIKVLAPNPVWDIEKMPTARVMGDMLNLPNGEILMLNGAQKGASGWQFAEEPNLAPVLYTPHKPKGQRFKTLTATKIPRMYHSTSAVLPDTKILVAGSNTNDAYKFKNVKFPTELRVEKFIPPYLDGKLNKFRPTDVNLLSKKVTYRQPIALTCQFKEHGPINKADIMVTMYEPPFTTHGYSMNQRLLSLVVSSFTPGPGGNYKVQALAPPRGELAPPGFYLIFINHQGVPSTGSWIHLN